MKLTNKRIYKELCMLMVHLANKPQDYITVLDDVLKNTSFNINYQSKKNKDNLLFVSIAVKSFPIFKYLIDNGYDVNSQDLANNTPLSYTLYEDNLQMTQYLVEHGADVNKGVSEWNDVYPLMLCCFYCSLKIMEVLVNAGADRYKLTPPKIVNYNPDRIDIASPLFMCIKKGYNGKMNALLNLN